MVCKFCKAEISENHRYCPECGKRQDAAVGNAAGNPEQKAKKKLWQPILLITGFVAVGMAMILVSLQLFGISILPEEDIYRKSAYAASDKKAAQKADTVVAEFYGETLDNALLQVFYAKSLESFLAEYGDYCNELGLDLSKPLSKQTSYYDETMTWEQLFLQDGIDGWQSYVLWCTLADEDGFVLDESWQKMLDEMPQTLKQDALTNNYSSADEMLKEFYGKSCTMEVYMKYVRLVFKANAYITSTADITDEQIQAAFAKNEATFAEKGITKTSGLAADVRHILIEPEGGVKGSNGLTTYSESEWAACLSKAEQVLNEWKAGDADENSFKQLVSQYTADYISKADGGLYEGVVADGTYMEAFQNWAVDPNRVVGDTGIVKTDDGYHIMYYVDNEPEWMHYSRKLIQNERTSQRQSRMKTLLRENPAEIQYSKIVLFDPLS